MKNSLLNRILAARGFTSQDEIDRFLSPDLSRDWADPYNINGMDELANRLEDALRQGKRIVVYGDYDLDGISATAVMLRGLKEINKHVQAGSSFSYFLPDRFDEGYGFSKKSLERLFKQDQLPDLIISVDCGITADKEVKTLLEAGIDVLITDHHSLSENKPNDVCLIDPKADDENCDDAILAGVGVALKLIQVMCNRFALPNLWLDLIDFAALGTLADVMSLTGQNRALVSYGLDLINNHTRPCIKALLSAANKQPGKLSSTDVTYFLVPRLNAAGRMNKADIALELLLCDDYAKCYELALEIENLNNMRRDITDEILQKANHQAKNIIENNPNIKCLILSGQNWHKGVLGIVAAKIAEIYNLCAIVLSLDDNLATGSGRSIGNINLHDACLKSFDKYEKFGGHAKACGLCIRVQDLDELNNNLDSYLNKLDPKEFEKTWDYDLEIDLNDLSIDEIESLSSLEPYGQDNREPVFLSKNIFLKWAKAVGQLRNHLSCNLSDGAHNVFGIMFNVLNIDKYLKLDSTVNAIYNARVEEYQSQKNVKMQLFALVPDEVESNCENSVVDKMLNHYGQIYKKIADTGDFIKNNVNLYNQDIFNRSSLYKTNIQTCKDNNCRFENHDKNVIQSEVIKAFIGDNGQLHKSQQECLDLLSQYKNVLSVMPTGRGKSLIFQVYASVLALCSKKMSIFVYPLRALISDQEFHLKKNLEKFGLNICALNGETSNENRKKIMQDIKDHKLDIMLTTPEYLAIHIDEIAELADVSFIVIDEAHHIGTVKIGDRTAYGHLPKICEKLNNPQVLALSATVNDEINLEIQKFIKIDDVIKDNYERNNLFIDDRRNINDRDDYLVSICASGEKTVIYVNSQQQTIDLARLIKSRAPHIAMQVGFYNAGMAKEDRNKIEDMFRKNQLCVLVATSAFGEGVNISDIRHVCLYHLPFSNVEFNQMSGRCGRDGKESFIHLLYNRADASINTQILQMCNPGHEKLAKIYSWLKSAVDKNNGCFEFCNDNLVQWNSRAVLPADPASILCAIDIFNELGIIKFETYQKDNETYSKIAVNEMSSKVNLEDSSRFCEGQNELNNFDAYRLAAMRKTADELQNMFRHPILPSIVD